MHEKKQRVETDMATTEGRQALQDLLDSIAQAELDRDKAKLDQAFVDFNRRLEAEAKSIVERMGAVNEKTAEALILAAKTELAQRISVDMAPLTAIGGGDADEMFKQMLSGSFFQDIMQNRSRTNGSLLPQPEE